MSRLVDSTTRTAGLRLNRHGGDLIAVAVIFVAYTVTIWVGLQQGFIAAVAGGVANTVPVVIFGAAARHIIATRLVGRSLMVQAASHVVLCAAFALISYWLLIILLGLENGLSATEFTVRSFGPRGSAWQLLENVTIYGVLAAMTYVRAWRAQIASASSFHAAPAPDGDPREIEPSRYFIRSGDDIKPIEVDRVVSIAGADDYAEVTTLDGKHLVRMTLTEFEKTLDATRFVRVHRSWIVNLNHVDRAEPAGGGRMLLHMENGMRISASRAGSRLLRDRVI
jgi:two-component system, LytTR family, response regulator